MPRTMRSFLASNSGIVIHRMISEVWLHCDAHGGCFEGRSQRAANGALLRDTRSVNAFVCISSAGEDGVGCHSEARKLSGAGAHRAERSRTERGIAGGKQEFVSAGEREPLKVATISKKIHESNKHHNHRVRSLLVLKAWDHATQQKHPVDGHLHLLSFQHSFCSFHRA